MQLFQKNREKKLNITKNQDMQGYEGYFRNVTGYRLLVSLFKM